MTEVPTTYWAWHLIWLLPMLMIAVIIALAVMGKRKAGPKKSVGAPKSRGGEGHAEETPAAGGTTATHGGHGHGGGHSAEKAGGPLHWFLTVFGIVIVLLIAVPVLATVLGIIGGVYRYATASYPQKERVFVAEHSCQTTPQQTCKAKWEYGKIALTSGRPVSVKFHGTSEWIPLSISGNFNIPANKFKPGEAEFVSTDSYDLTPVQVRVGHYEWRDP